MTTTYESQRKERLSEVIFDYLTDENTSAERLYTDIRDEIISSMEYFQKYSDKCRRARDLITDDFFPDLGDYQSDNITDADKNDWNSFWDEVEDSCDTESTEEKRDLCREYNMREVEYYNQRAKLDAEYAKKKKEEEELNLRIQASSPFNDGYTQEFYVEQLREQISRNDPERIDYKEPWIYESPDGGKTITKRKPGSLEKYPITRDEINEHYKNLGNAD